MRIYRTESFKKDYQNLPKEIQKRADKQLKFLLENPRHPSLQAKKMEDPRNIWEGRITKGYRFTFQITGETYTLRRIGKHEETLRKP